jgi:hypothetical protein
MSMSNIEEAATQLLVAFHELSGGVLTQPVPLRGSGATNEGAADRAGMDAGSTLPDVAVRYLLNKGWLEERQQEEPGADPLYVITPPGVDEARRQRGLQG